MADSVMARNIFSLSPDFCHSYRENSEMQETSSYDAEDVAHYKVQELSAVRCAKTAETIQMPLG